MINELENMINNITNEVTVIPINNASVKIGDEKDFKNSDCENCEINVISDENGDFEGGRIIPGFTLTFQVKVSSTGFIEAVGELENGENKLHAIVAVLVKNDE